MRTAVAEAEPKDRVGERDGEGEVVAAGEARKRRNDRKGDGSETRERHPVAVDEERRASEEEHRGARMHRVRE